MSIPVDTLIFLVASMRGHLSSFLMQIKKLLPREIPAMIGPFHFAYSFASMAR
jgi:hypothetical protein